MNRRRLKLVLAIGVMSLLGAVGVAVATGGNNYRERLTGYEEIPTLSTPANGQFKLRINRFSNTLDYTLSYEGFETRVQQAHIHLGARAFNGGVSVFLCSNVGSPVPTEQCPTPAGTVSGTLDASDVIGPRGSGHRCRRVRRAARRDPCGCDVRERAQRRSSRRRDPRTDRERPRRHSE